MSELPPATRTIFDQNSISEVDWCRYFVVPIHFRQEGLQDFVAFPIAALKRLEA
jgi:hypothetical protein